MSLTSLNLSMIVPPAVVPQAGGLIFLRPEPSARNLVILIGGVMSHARARK